MRAPLSLSLSLSPSPSPSLSQTPTPTHSRRSVMRLHWARLSLTLALMCASTKQVGLHVMLFLEADVHAGGNVSRERHRLEGARTSTRFPFLQKSSGCTARRCNLLGMTQFSTWYLPCRLVAICPPDSHTRAAVQRDSDGAVKCANHTPKINKSTYDPQH